MIRHTINPRIDWQTKVESLGLTYHSNGIETVDAANWNEGVCYEFTMDQILDLESATEQLQFMCLEAVDYVVNKRPDYMDKFEIPYSYREYIKTSWNRFDPFVMGRFDLAYNPETNDIKMLEYNADTPTMAIETAIVQWYWLQELYPDCDQFNSLHEKLIEQYRSIKSKIKNNSPIVFSSLRQEYSVEEYNHVSYFQNLAELAGIPTIRCDIEDIGWNDDNKQFRTFDEENIQYWYKLYPWEWLANEEFGKYLPLDKVGCIEPVWKMILSNKAILPILWEIFPNNKLLLQSSFQPLNCSYVEKPILSREGANIIVNINGRNVLTTDGSYGNSNKIYQEYFEPTKIDNKYSIICSWVVGDEPAGMIIRESDKKIITGQSSMVPHFIKG